MPVYLGSPRPSGCVFRETIRAHALKLSDTKRCQMAFAVYVAASSTGSYPFKFVATFLRRFF